MYDAPNTTALFVENLLNYYYYYYYYYYYKIIVFLQEVLTFYPRSACMNIWNQVYMIFFL